MTVSIKPISAYELAARLHGWKTSDLVRGSLTNEIMRDETAAFCETYQAPEGVDLWEGVCQAYAIPVVVTAEMVRNMRETLVTNIKRIRPMLSEDEITQIVDDALRACGG